MSSLDTTDDNDLLIDDDDALAPVRAEGAEAEPWLVLVVDDDVDVHVVTKFALSNASYLGRRLSFLHAYSGKEAMDILRDTPNIALVLLDVIMETDDAGLRVARQIRSDLHNELTRVVLRTGQPGQALEHSIIVDYDINDFWCKADLTTRKLFTTVISSLRAYSSLAHAAQARAALDAELVKIGNVLTTLDEHALVVTFDARGKIVDANDKFCSALHLRRDHVLGRDLRAIDPAASGSPVAAEVRQALERNGVWKGDIHTSVRGERTIRCTVRVFKDAAGAPKQYIAIGTVTSMAAGMVHTAIDKP